MSFKEKLNINVDKLRVCYRQPKGLFERLQKKAVGDFENFDYFSLRIIENEFSKIRAQVLLDTYEILGEFSFNNSRKYDGLCFFTFANKALYTVHSVDFSTKEKRNYLQIFYWIEEKLDLKINNLTLLELASDTNVNASSKIRKMIKDYHNFDMFLNGRKIADEKRKIENYSEQFGRSRAKVERNPTIYLAHAKAEDVEMRVYNKSREIEKSGKNYVSEWDDFGGQEIHRAEIIIKNADFKLWQDYAREKILREWGEIEPLLGFLQLDLYKVTLWNFQGDRLLYFREKSTGKKISLFDVLLGEAGV